MEKYFKVSESELLELIASTLRLNALEAEGVDNWCFYGENFNEFLGEAMKDAGLDQNDEDEDFSFRDLAKIYLKDYPEV